MKGFTLVELIVVIAIIGLISTIGLTSYNNAGKNSRDAKKKSDIDAIAKAYELTYNAAISQYRALTNADFSTGRFPNDDPSYEFILGPDSSIRNLNNYKICSQLEDHPDSNSCNTSPTPATCYCRVSTQGVSTSSP